MPQEWKTAVQARAGYVNGIVTLKEPWGPEERAQVLSYATLLSELAQKENVNAEVSRNSLDWRTVACQIKRCVEDLDHAVKLVDFTQEQLHESITKQMEKITGIKPLFNADTPYSEILHEWTMDKCGWKSATQGQNETLDLSMLLLKEKQDMGQATQGTKGCYESKDVR